MSDRRPYSRWRLGLFAVGVWIAINAFAYLFIRSFEESGRSGPHISKRAIEAFEEISIQLRAAEDRPLKIRYRLMKPGKLVAGRKYPVLLFLHGGGEVGYDNRRQLRGLPEQMADEPWCSRWPCFFVTPQCPPGQRWSDQTDVLLAILAHILERFPADPQRMYLTGLSMGGFGTWELATRRPELFAAVVPICGGGDPNRAERLVKVPIWAVHGDADEVVPVEESRRTVEAIRKAGGNPRFSVLKGVGHDSWTPAYRDPNGVIPWMFQQINTRARGADSSPQAPEYLSVPADSRRESLESLP